MAESPQSSQSLWGLFASIKNLDKISDEFWDSFKDDEFEDLSSDIEDKIDAYKYIEDMYLQDAERLKILAAQIVDKAKVQINRADRVRSRLIKSMEFFNIDRAKGKMYTASRSKRRDPRPVFTRLIPDEDDLLKYPSCVRISYEWKKEPDFVLASRLIDYGVIGKRYSWDQDVVKYQLNSRKEGEEPAAIAEVAAIRELQVFKWDIQKKDC